MSEPKIREIDTLQPGQMGRRYRVGTFPGVGRRQPHAYLRYYNPAWDGCVEYDVIATSGAIAKQAAIKARARAVGRVGS